MLKTLPMREYRAGLYEALKCGIIGDAGLFRLFEEQHKEILARDPSVVEKLIADSVRLKASVVSADEREGGLRQVLNLGHTIGHALEAETGYKLLLHGEAVGWGLLAATHIALSSGKLDSVTAGRIMNAVLALGELPRMNIKPASILKRLKFDKKTRQGAVILFCRARSAKSKLPAMWTKPPCAPRSKRYESWQETSGLGNNFSLDLILAGRDFEILDGAALSALR